MYEAFFWISNGRQFNETGPQPVPLSEFICYLNERNIVNRDDRVEFLRYFRVMDTTLISLVQDKMSKERERLLNRSQAGKKGR